MSELTKETADKLRAIGTIGQDDSGDPSWLFRLADQVEAFARVLETDLPDRVEYLTQDEWDAWTRAIEASQAPDSAVAPPSA